MNLNKLLVLCFLFFVPNILLSQESINLDYDFYMDAVKKNNYEYAANLLNVDIALAQSQASKIFSDPIIGVLYYNNDDAHMRMGQGFSVEISKSISFGKISARVDLAKKNKELQKAMTSYYFHNLRVDATLAYFNALKNGIIYRGKKEIADKFDVLMQIDSLNMTKRVINISDYKQGKLEYAILESQILDAKYEYEKSLYVLNVYMGNECHKCIYSPVGMLKTEAVNYDIDTLMNMASRHHPELLVAMKQIEVAQKSLLFTKRERNVDLFLALGYQYNAQAANLDAFSPMYNGFYISMSVPIPFSHINKGVIRERELAQKQKQLYYEQTLVELSAKLRTTYSKYQLALSQLDVNNDLLVESSYAVLLDRMEDMKEAKISSTELIYAFKTYEETLRLNLNTKYDVFSSLIEIFRVVGVWNN